jgi:hypothetical protein
MKEQLTVLEMRQRPRPSLMQDSLTTLCERIAAKQQSQTLLRRMGLDSRQFVVFLGLFRQLSERDEFIGSIGVNRFNIAYIALFAAGLGFIPWSLFAVALANAEAPQIADSGATPESLFLLATLTVTFVVTFLIFIREAARALFNPVEASMLAHTPIHSSTYAAAKILHIFVAVVYIVLGLNAYPALLSTMFLAISLFERAPWFFPLAQLASAFLIGFWTAFVICALYGLMRRFVPANLLKTAVAWIQCLSLSALVAIPTFRPQMFFQAFLPGLFTARFGSSRTWLPSTWFAEIGRLGCSGSSWRLGLLGAISILASALMIWFGMRSFSGGYLTEAISNEHRWARRSGAGKAVFSWWGAASARALARSPSGIAAFCFISKVIRRDWLLRRLIWSQTWVPLLALLGVTLTLDRFGIASPISGDRSFAHVLPHLLGIIAVALCVNLAFSASSKASWVYLTAPIGSARAFARGAFWALWIPAAALPHFALVFLFLRQLNWEEAAFIAGFNLIVVTLYLAFSIELITDMPFSTAATESRAMGNTVYVQIYWLMAIFIPVALHQALCKHLWVGVIAAIVLVAVTVSVLRMNLTKLDNKIRWRLYEVKMRSNQMFREIT